MDREELLAGRYRLSSPLGTGTMSVVWRAHDVVLRREVAVKVLAGEQRADPRLRRGIRVEALAAARMSHPNIASVYDYGEAPDRSGEPMPYLVTEFLRGHNLNDRLASGPVPPRFAFRIGADVAGGLAAAHAARVVHRDVKPSNVMLTPARAKVIDFGIAAPAGTIDNSALANCVVGTPAYVAPERVLEDTVDCASDVYALGVLLYRLLANDLPWSVTRPADMIIEHVYGEPAPLPDMADVPAEVVHLYDACVAKDPADRPSAEQVHAALSAAAGRSRRRTRRPC